MSTAADIERHLFDHPDDEAAWLALAPHLDAEGDVRGELIRLEQRAEGDPEAGAQIRRLIDAHREAWGGPLPAGEAEPGWGSDSPRVRVRWRHGFITGLELAWARDSRAQLQAFLQAPQSRMLRTLAITRVGPGDGQLAPKPAATARVVEQLCSLDLSRLVSLSLAFLGLRHADIGRLSEGMDLPRLRRLDLRYNLVGPAGAEHLARWPVLDRVEALSLQATRLGSRGLQPLAARSLPRLRRIDLRHCALGAEGATALAAAPWLPGLEDLLLSRFDVGPRGSAKLAASPLRPPLRAIWRGLAHTWRSGRQHED